MTFWPKVRWLPACNVDSTESWSWSFFSLDGFLYVNSVWMCLDKASIWHRLTRSEGLRSRWNGLWQVIQHIHKKKALVALAAVLFDRHSFAESSFPANHFNWLLSQMLCVSRHRGHVVNLFAQKGHVSKVRMCTPRDRRVFASAWISKGVFRHQLQCQTHRLKAHWLKPTNILASCSSKCRLTRFGFLDQCSISYASRDAMPGCCFKSGLKLFGF